jgi:hypothetical protein
MMSNEDDTAETNDDLAGRFDELVIFLQRSVKERRIAATSRYYPPTYRTVASGEAVAYAAVLEFLDIEA